MNSEANNKSKVFVTRRLPEEVWGELASQVDETAFVTVDDASRVYRGYVQRRGQA